MFNYCFILLSNIPSRLQRYIKFPFKFQNSINTYPKKLNRFLSCLLSFSKFNWLRSFRWFDFCFRFFVLLKLL